MFEKEISEITVLAREAGTILMDIYATDFDVAFKGKANPVTEADTRANAFIVERLAECFPDDRIIAEESDNDPVGRAKGRCWYVDPLDGTKEFVKKNGEFAVMIGLAIDGESRFGVVYQPALDKLYRGVVGGEAYLVVGDEERMLEVSDACTPSDLSLVVSRSHRAASTDQLVEQLGITKETQSGSVGLNIGLLAEQCADLYVNLSDKSSAWDACAPEAIIRAAGGRFADVAGNPFHYGGADLNNRRGILACNGAAFDAVAPVIRGIAEATGFI